MRLAGLALLGARGLLRRSGARGRRSRPSHHRQPQPVHRRDPRRSRRSGAAAGDLALQPRSARELDGPGEGAAVPGDRRHGRGSARARSRRRRRQRRSSRRRRASAFERLGMRRRDGCRSLRRSRRARRRSRGWPRSPGIPSAARRWSRGSRRRSPPPRRRRARRFRRLLWQAGGIVPGEATLIAELLAHTGFASHAAARGLGQADVPAARSKCSPIRRG